MSFERHACAGEIAICYPEGAGRKCITLELEAQAQALGLSEQAVFHGYVGYGAGLRNVSECGGLCSSIPDRWVSTGPQRMYERTPRGGARWAPSSVRSLLDRAEKLGHIAQNWIAYARPIRK